MGSVPKDHDPNVIGVCTECKSDQPPSYLYRNPFGDEAPCKYCGGVIVVTYRDRREQTLHQKDRERGLVRDDNE